MAVWLITGCSTGLGRALAEAAADVGHRVVATARNPRSVDDLVRLAPERVLAAPLDVGDPVQIRDAVAAGADRFGAIDVLVNNAGYGYRAAIEEGDDAEVRELFQTHFFGPVNLIKAVLPGMRARRSGAIVNISSIGAVLQPAGSGYYGAAKAALEAMSGSLRREVAPLGISVTVVEPGAFRTDFAGRSLTGSATEIDDYAATVGLRRVRHETSDGRQAGNPIRGARAIIEAVEGGQPPDLLLLGADAVAGVGAALADRIAEIEAWRTVSEGTSFGDAVERT